MHEPMQRTVSPTGRVRPTHILRSWSSLNLCNLEADFIRDGILPGGFDQLAPTTQYYINGIRERRDEIEM